MALIAYCCEVNADSECWPEELMIGTKAIGYIERINSLLLSDAAPQKPVVDGNLEDNSSCKILTYKNIKDGASKIEECKNLGCMKNDCGVEDDHAFLPIEKFSPPYVRVSLRNGENVWIKFKSMPQITPVLPLWKTGYIAGNSDNKNTLHFSPNGKLFPLPNNTSVIVTTLEIERHLNEVWVEADISPILVDNDYSVDVGESLGKAFFLYKNNNGSIVNVVSDNWCD